MAEVLRIVRSLCTGSRWAADGPYKIIGCNTVVRCVKFTEKEMRTEIILMVDL